MILLRRTYAADPFPPISANKGGLDAPPGLNRCSSRVGRGSRTQLSRDDVLAHRDACDEGLSACLGVPAPKPVVADHIDLPFEVHLRNGWIDGPDNMSRASGSPHIPVDGPMARFLVS
jgi:hypothetical protein